MEGIEKREPSYIVGEDVNWCHQYGKQYGGSLKTKNSRTTILPAVPLLGIYLEKTKTNSKR